MASSIRTEVERGAAGARQATEAVARSGAPWLQRAARLGFAASGLVYVTMGVIALQASLSGRRTTGSRGAIATLGEQPGGRLLLVLVGVGLLGYAAWRLIGAVSDADRDGSGGKGIALRLGRAGSGLAYGSLGVWALRVVQGARAAAGEEGARAVGWTARLLALPAGRWLVIAVGLGVVAYALQQLRKACTDGMRRSVERHLDLHALGEDGHAAVLRLARGGVAARGVVFGIIGFFLAYAGWRHDPRQATGLDGALAALAATPLGAPLLSLVALGFVAFGAYQLVNARWRVIPVR